jgi:hypothetical protein
LDQPYPQSPSWNLDQPWEPQPQNQWWEPQPQTVVEQPGGEIVEYRAPSTSSHYETARAPSTSSHYETAPLYQPGYAQRVKEAIGLAPRYGPQGPSVYSRVREYLRGSPYRTPPIPTPSPAQIAYPESLNPFA